MLLLYCNNQNKFASNVNPVPVSPKPMISATDAPISDDIVADTPISAPIATPVVNDIYAGIPADKVGVIKNCLYNWEQQGLKPQFPNFKDGQGYKYIGVQINTPLGALNTSVNNQVQIDPNDILSRVSSLINGETPSANSVGVVDNDVTNYPRFILVEGGISVSSNPIYQLMNPNGWYCINFTGSVSANVKFQIDCKAKHMTSKIDAAALTQQDVNGNTKVQLGVGQGNAPGQLNAAFNSNLNIERIGNCQ